MGADVEADLLGADPLDSVTGEAFGHEMIDHDLIVLTDEIYSELTYAGAKHVSIASLAGMLERTISCFTFSKSYSMTGWRAGYAVAAEPWMTALRKLLLYSTTGLATPTQWAVLAAVQSPPELLARRRRRTYPTPVAAARDRRRCRRM